MQKQTSAQRAGRQTRSRTQSAKQRPSVATTTSTQDMEQTRLTDLRFRLPVRKDAGVHRADGERKKDGKGTRLDDSPVSTLAHTIETSVHAVADDVHASTDICNKVRAAAKKLSSTDGNDISAAERLMRAFDMNLKYGPCIGISRLERLQRAQQLGLEVPQTICHLLQPPNAQPCVNGRVAAMAHIDRDA
ncbi:DNA polymerase delta, subunit 4-domain-containing protein [Thamnocephalis sphaerospora]|uniref:DNA polymerase delta, subunit 4-domain-containing protein n=1 Tax=Thamnocephalis sphaerospora TaxID=78915 RepID=A0A4P9XMR1_9FUNG|nr:DNA polymerase delta, subunit 4-domain-containing protein [Thamnocephalis sphaerospora]|eukprot:RKP07176.1 DNA polymerase delta, subunit 4-domain-containing protein [Thamnocephalis sphaerospora]